MKKTNRVLAFLLAIAMLLGMAVPMTAQADGNTTDTTESVTLHKLLMDKATLAAWNSEDVEKAGYNGTQDLNGLKGITSQVAALAGKTFSEIKGVYFAFQYNGGPNDGKYVTRDPNTGAYGAADDVNAANVLGGETTDTGIKFITKDLKGNFKIVEVPEKSTYIGKNGEQLADHKAVPVEITLPLINKDGTVKDAHVYPKNTEEKPKIDKNFAQGTAGTSPNLSNGAEYTNYQKEKDTINRRINDAVTYDVKTLIPASSRYQKLVWNDIMDKELTYNKDLKVTADNGLSFTEGTDYTVIHTDHGFVLTFTKTGIDKVNAVTAQKKDVTISLAYTAKLNGDAVVDKPYNNDITLDYGNKPGNDTTPKEGNPSNQKITVDKSWAVDGKTVTAADKTVTAVFTLQEKQANGSWKDVDSYTATIADNFTHEFTGLDDSKTYRVVEQVSGYAPEYVSFDNGTVVIKDNKDSTNPKPLNPTEPKVETYGKKFVKTNDKNKDDTELKRLFGAEFYVKNSAGKYLAIKSAAQATGEAKAYEDAQTAYLNAIKAFNGQGANKPTAAEIEQLKVARDAAFLKARAGYEWVDKADNALVLTSNDQGQFEITGLEAGSYQLEEKTAPEGFAKLNGPVDFTVGKNTYTTEGVNIPYEKTGTTDDAQQITNKQVTIPQTGGMGTALFIGGGIALMLGAGYVFLKNRKEEMAAE